MSTTGRPLGPGWRSGGGGKGFQPPPAAEAAPDAEVAPRSPTSRNRAGSHASADSGGWNEVGSGGKTKGGGGSNINHFAALSLDDDSPSGPGGSSVNKTANGGGGGGSGGLSSPRRSDALRQGGSGAGGAGGGGPTKRSGRSLADLAKSIGPSDPAPPPGGPGGRGGPGGDRRSGGPRGPGGPRGDPRGDRDRDRTGSGGGGTDRRSLPDFEWDKSIVRYTREKLLSLRPAGSGGELPAKLQHLEGVSIISETANDPVCFDTFDPDEIWAQALKERRAAANVGGIGVGVGVGGPPPAPGPPRGFGGGGGGNRWERGVALPPSERRGGRRNDDNVNNPDDLWDDPTDGPTDAASDFSAFGGSLDDVPRAGGGSSTGLGGSSGFDLSAMSDAAKKFEEELHGGKDSSRVSSASNLEGGLEDDGDAHTRKIGDGTEIRSGSGDDVNVFEDFGDPNSDAGPTAAATTSESKGGIESGGEKSASSRLMEMIGVGGGGGGGAQQPAAQQEPAPQPATSNIGGVPLNPWGEPVQQQQQAAVQGMDIAARMAEEQRARQQEEEEAKRRAEIERQQREAAARQQQQQQQGPNQVELILMERVCAILENSWGRSDLMSILTTLHAEDSRVIPLLGNVDALRALVARHPRRIQLAKDPSLGAEMAILLLSNAQFQQAKAQEEQQRAQQEELQRRQQLLQQQMAQEPVPPVNPNAPWFYTDPNGQVQGPFGGSEMRQWLEAGYFKADLPISQNPNARFLPLGRIFPNLGKAFQTEQAPPPAPEPPVPQLVEEVPVPMPSSPVRAPMEEPQAVVAAPEPEPSAAPVAANETSQLKAMLGLGGGAAAAAAPEPEVVESPVEAKAALTVEEPARKTKKKKEKTAKAAKAAAPAEAAPSASKEEEVPAPAPTAPAWGGAASGKAPGKKKSMSEIQQEEARVAASRAKEQPQRSGGGWAGIAASGGTTAWTGDAVKPASRVNPAPAQAGAAGSQASKPRQQSKAAVAQANKGGAAASNNSSAADEFGESGKMSPQLEAWCREQMKKISGSEDLTLVSFCMTLNDPGEIKQYLTAYLGSTPQVNNFASEFILHKDGKKSQQDQWESAGASKKGRKKRGGKQ